MAKTILKVYERTDKNRLIPLTVDICVDPTRWKLMSKRQQEKTIQQRMALALVYETSTEE